MNATIAAAMDGLKQRYMEDGKARPSPTVQGSVAAVGGLIFAGALNSIAIIRLQNDGGRSVGVLLNVLLAAASFVVLLTTPKSVHNAVIAALAIVAGALPVWIFVGSDGNPTTIVALLVVVLCAGFLLAPQTDHHPIFVGIGLTALWILVVSLVNDASEVADVSQFGDTESYLSLIVGLGYLVAVFLLDKRGLQRAAQPVVAAGTVAFIVGLIGVGAQLGDVPGSLIAIIGGVVLAFIGEHGARRFTTWLGALAIGQGAVGVVLNLVKPDGESYGASVIAAIVGVALPGAVYFWPQLREQLDERLGAKPFDPATLRGSTSWGETTAAATVVAEPVVEQLSLPAGRFEEPVEAPTEPVLPPAADWYPDPTHRHELRYFDGNAWTQHVANGGAAEVDMSPI